MQNEKRLMEDLEQRCLEMRKDVLFMSMCAGRSGAHVGGSLSMIEIVAVLYFAIMNYNKGNMSEEERDRFILSKGHGVIAQYAGLKQLGIIEETELETFKANVTELTGHPSMNLKKGIEFSSGSLGQGLSLGVGTCLALKRKGNNQSSVYVLLGDGECDEGAVWEAAASAAHYRLNNLVAIVDNNRLQYDGETRSVLNMNSLSDKWRSFGWQVFEVNGHNVSELYNAMQQERHLPTVIIAETVKGKGVSFMENNPAWHHGVLSKAQYEKAIEQLEVVKC